MGGLKWTSRSLTKIAEEMETYGIKVSKTTVGKWLKECGYSLRKNCKCISRGSPPGRNEQMKSIQPRIFTTILFIREVAPTWNLLLHA